MKTITPVIRKGLGYGSSLIRVFGFGLLLLFGLLWTITSQTAQAASASTLNFQARLQNASGGIVADGYYNIEFKLYDVSTGGSSLWTEDYLNSNAQGVRVKNGYLSANLGSISAFPGTINWDQDLWLTMTVRGTGSCAFTSCTPADAEMNPRLKLTSVPYAFRAGQLAKFNGTTGFTSTLNLAPPTGGNQTFTIADQGVAGSFTLLTSGQVIQNGTSVQSNSNFNVSGSGTAGTSFLAPLFDTAGSTALNIGTNNATSINLNKDTNLAAGKKLVFANVSNSNKVNIISGVTTGSGYTLTLPTALSGVAGDCVKDTTGTGVLGFGSCGTGGGSGGGVTTVGTFSATTSYTNGATITSGTTITLGAADGSNPGLVSKDAQSFGGDKTFQGQVWANNTVAGDFAFKASNSSATGLGIYGYINSNSSANDVLRLDGSGGTVLSVKSNGDTNITGNVGVGVAPGTGSRMQVVAGAGQVGLSVQGGSGSNIAEFLNSSGSVVASLDSAGGLHAPSVEASVFGMTTATSVGIYTGNTARLSFDGTTGAVTVSANFLQSGATTFGTGTGAVSLNGNTTLAAGKTLILVNGSNSNTVSIQSGTTSTSYTLTLPTAVGASGECLKATNGTGALGFGSCSAGGGGITAVGALDGNTKSADGASVSGSTLYMQTADANYAGLMSTGAQTIAGAKTFTSNAIISVMNTQTAAPMALLEQDGSGDSTLEFRGLSNSFFIGVDTSNSSAFTINSKNASLGLGGGNAYSVINYVQSNTDLGGTRASSMPVAFSSNVTNGNFIGMFVTFEDAFGTASVNCTDSQGNTYSEIGVGDSVAIHSVVLCYTMASATGANTITATFSSSVTFRRATVVEYNNVSTTQPIDVSATNIGTASAGVADSVTSTAVTPTSTSAMIIGASMDSSSNTTTVSAGTGFTVRGGNTTDFMVQEKLMSNSSSVASTNTYAAAHTYVSVVAALNPKIVSGSGGTPNAASHVQSTAATSSGNVSGTSISKAFTSSTTTGNLIVAVVAMDSTATQSFTCSDNIGNVYGNILLQNDSANNRAIGVCYAKGITGGSTTVTATFGASTTYRDLVIHEYTNADPTTPIDVSTGATTTGSTATNGVSSGTISTTQSNDVILGATYDTAGTATISAGTGFLPRVSVGNYLLTEDMTQSITGTTAATFTYGTAHRANTIVVAIKGVSTGGNPGGVISDAYNNPLFRLSQSGALTLQNSINSGGAFVVNTSTGLSLFSVDTLNNMIQIGSAAADANYIPLVLDSYNGSSDPANAAAVNGAMYYNSTMGVFRCYENGAWADCLSHHIVTLGSDVSDSTGACTLDNLTGMSMAVAANRTYRFHVTLDYTTAATTTGIGLGATGPTNTFLSYQFTTAASTSTIGGGGGNGTTAGGCAASAATTTANSATLDGIITTTASGTVQITFATEINASAVTVKAGGTLEWW